MFFSESKEFADTDKLVVVGLLRGSFVFIADLVRELDLPIEVDFLEASSYGDAMESSREVRILKDLRGAIEGRDVLVVEDIVDTGHTLNHVTKLLKSRKPERLKSIALLDIALRRRFVFEAMYPKYNIPGAKVHDDDILEKINNQVKDSKGHDFQIGHSYFMNGDEDLLDRMNLKVIPLLLEYYMNDEAEVKKILYTAGLEVDSESWPLRITGRRAQSV